jgi:hypothetical protein
VARRRAEFTARFAHLVCSQSLSRLSMVVPFERLLISSNGNAEPLRLGAPTLF